MHSPILTPLVMLAAWSMVMWGWMYAQRLPAVRRAKMQLDPEAPRGEQMASLPPRVRWKADNYNHLMEQPTVFYAVALALALLERGDGWALRLAWAYVGLRVVHSLVQSLWNRIEVRFSLFALSSFALIGMIAIAVRAVV
ncbi:MAG: MAPEG family protein [Myxococcota bacterium]|nr:MAPEG family protein [Myxococcota bacterium]